MRSMTFLLIAALCGALHAGAGPVEWSSGVTYTYDASGNITLIGTDHHVYDVAGRLVQSDTNGIRRNFEYDGFGNRTKCLQPGTDCQYGYTVEQATNRLNLPPGSYDVVGNLKKFEGRTYDYDAISMQITDRTQVPGREFIYTADDERIAVYTVPAAQWRWTLRDPSGKVLREMTSRNGTGAELGTAAWVLTKDYVWRGNQLLASRKIEAGNANPTTYHYHLDHLGTPRRITDDTDAIVGIHDYHAYGREAPGGTNEPSLSLLKYTGHERDIVGTEGSETLDYMHARYYSTTVGRFLSIDPVMQQKRAMMKPQLWNRYAYALNNPMIYTDPSGTTVYVVTYTSGNKEGDDEFRRAALTRAHEIQSREGFDPTKDKVLLRGAGTKGDFQNVIRDANSMAKQFGKVGEISLFSHAGPADGPIFPGNRPGDRQFSARALSGIGVNWESGGCARFFGCNTGINFTQAFANAQGVRAYGYEGSAGFSATKHYYTEPSPAGPLYLIYTTGFANDGVSGYLTKHFGDNVMAIPMEPDDPQP